MEAARSRRAELASGSERNLAPAFRRTRIVGENETGARLVFSLWLANVRSTLVIRKQEKADERDAVARRAVVLTWTVATEADMSNLPRAPRWSGWRSGRDGRMKRAADFSQGRLRYAAESVARNGAHPFISVCVRAGQGVGTGSRVDVGDGTSRSRA